MRLFSADLFRHFGLGFVVGAVALAVFGSDAQQWNGDLVSPALAAETPALMMPAPEFVIAPEGN